MQRARNSRPDDLYIPQVPVKSHTLLRAWAADPVDVHRHFWAAGLHRAPGDQCAGIQLAHVGVCRLGGAFFLRQRAKRPRGCSCAVCAAAAMPGALSIGTKRAPKAVTPSLLPPLRLPPSSASLRASCCTKVASSTMISPVMAPPSHWVMVAEPATACPASLRISGTGLTSPVSASLSAAVGSVGRDQLCAAVLSLSRPASVIGTNPISGHN